MPLRRPHYQFQLQLLSFIYWLNFRMQKEARKSGMEWTWQRMRLQSHSLLSVLPISSQLLDLFHSPNSQLNLRPPRYPRSHLFCTHDNYVRRIGVTWGARSGRRGRTWNTTLVRTKLSIQFSMCVHFPSSNSTMLWGWVYKMRKKENV